MVPVVLVGVVSPLATDAYLAALPSMVVDLKASPALVQTTLTAFILCFAVGQLVVGPLSDRGGRRRFVLGGVAVSGVGSLACALSPGIGVLLLSRALQGVGAGAAAAVVRGVVADRSTGTDLARRLGLLFTFLVLTPVVAPSLGAGVLELAGWRTIFVVLAVLGALQFVAVLLGLRETPEPGNRALQRPGGLAAPPGPKLLLASRRFRNLLSLSTLSAVGGFTYVASSAFVLQNQLGLGVRAYALVFTLNALGLTAASVVFRQVVGRAGSRRLQHIGLIVSTLASSGLLVLALLAVAHHNTPSLAFAGPLLGLAVAATGLNVPATSVLLQEAGRSSPATAGALQGSASYVAGAAASPLLGLTGSPTIAKMALVLTVCGSLQLVLAARLRHDRDVLVEPTTGSPQAAPPRGGVRSTDTSASTCTTAAVEREPGNHQPLKDDAP